jgi:hypothetical protein
VVRRREELHHRDTETQRRKDREDRKREEEEFILPNFPSLFSVLSSLCLCVSVVKCVGE